jgi:hypothetical protein
MASGLILVSGLCRCGTSLMMQMLAAGGWPVFDQARAPWPGFEHPANTGEAPLPVDASGIMKWLDPQLFKPPMERVRGSIFLTRNLREQARSHLKFLSAVGVRTGGARWQVLADSLKHDEPVARGILAKLGPVLDVRFEDLVTVPRSVMAATSRWIGEPIDTETAAYEVCARVTGASCLPFMLETRLLERRAR